MLLIILYYIILYYIIMKNKKSKKNKRIIPKQKGGVSKEDGEIIFGIFIWALGLYCLFYIARCRCLNCCIESGVPVAATDTDGIQIVVHPMSPEPPPSPASVRIGNMIDFAERLPSTTPEARTDNIMLPVAKEILKVIAEPLTSGDERLDTVIANEMLWLVHSATTPEELLNKINNIMPAAIIIRGLTDNVEAEMLQINPHETGHAEPEAAAEEEVAAEVEEEEVAAGESQQIGGAKPTHSSFSSSMSRKTEAAEAAEAEAVEKRAAEKVVKAPALGRTQTSKLNPFRIGGVVTRSRSRILSMLPQV